MAKSVNKVILLGNVGKDPEQRATGGGVMVATFSLATTEKYKEKEETTWHNLKAFGKLAEIVQSYVSKGDKPYVEGKLTTNSWEDRQSGEKRYRTEIIVQELALLSQRPGKQLGRIPTGGADNAPITDDDIPF